MDVSAPQSARSSGRGSPTPTDAAADVAALLQDDGSEMSIEQRFARLAAATKQHLASDETARRGLAALLAQNEALHTQVAALRAETAGFQAAETDGSAIDETNPNDVRFARLAAETQRHLAADEMARRGRAALQAQNDALQKQVEALHRENAALRASSGAGGDADQDVVASLRHELAEARFKLMRCTQLQTVLAKAGVEVEKSVRKAGLVKMCMKTI